MEIKQDLSLIQHNQGTQTVITLSKGFLAHHGVRWDPSICSDMVGLHLNSNISASMKKIQPGEHSQKAASSQVELHREHRGDGQLHQTTEHETTVSSDRIQLPNGLTQPAMESFDHTFMPGS